MCSTVVHKLVNLQNDELLWPEAEESLEGLSVVLASHRR